MTESYLNKRAGSQEPVMEFHRRHLLLFMHRFYQLAGHFRTPSSSLLSHELFLAVEAATGVAKADWEHNRRTLPESQNLKFNEYFETFSRMHLGQISLTEGAGICVAALADTEAK